MIIILAHMFVFLVGLIHVQSPNSTSPGGRWFPCPQAEPSKRAYELFVASYTPVWISAFAVIVVFQLYEQFTTAWHYLWVCGGLALPLLLQPLLLPSAFYGSPDVHRPFWRRYAFQANLWLAIYSFIGNYWYTHYFYSVLEAHYSMPSHRLNNVPIAMFFATHFYFSSYHLASNLLLRKVTTSYKPSALRTVLFGTVVVVFSYVTAFLETLTISSYPYYSFRDRDMAYTVGSAFYGIYFLVSFPVFYFFNSRVDANNTDPATKQSSGGGMTLWEVVSSSCGCGMLILLLLDFVRLWLDVPLVVGIDPTVCRK